MTPTVSKREMVLPRLHSLTVGPIGGLVAMKRPLSILPSELHLTSPFAPSAKISKAWILKSIYV